MTKVIRGGIAPPFNFGSSVSIDGDLSIGGSINASSIVSETTFQENKNAQGEINQSIRQALDGYAIVNNTAATGDGYIAFFTGTGTNTIAGDNDIFFDRPTNTLLLEKLTVGFSSPLAPSLLNAHIISNDSISLRDPADSTRGVLLKAVTGDNAYHYFGVVDSETLGYIGNANGLDLQGHDIVSFGDLTATNSSSTIDLQGGSLLNAVISGYASDLTETQHTQQQNQVNQSIRQALDGYAVVSNTAATGDGYIAFFTGTGTAIAGDNDLFYDRANGRLGVNTTPYGGFHMLSQATDTTPAAFTSDDFVIGGAGSDGATNSGAFFLRYNKATDEGFLGALSPSVAWRDFTIGAGITKFQNGSGVRVVSIFGASSISGIALNDNGDLLWANSADSLGGSDISLRRASAGVLTLGNGTPGSTTGGSLIAKNITVTSDISIGGSIINSDLTQALQSIKQACDGYLISDQELKEQIQPLNGNLELIEQLNPVSFNWNEKAGLQFSRYGVDVGLIAQEVAEILPNLVIESENGFKQVNYNKLIIYLIGAVKELSQQRLCK